MLKFHTCILDPRAEVTRQQMRQLPKKDLCSGTMRLALHLSDVEAESLKRLNPDTLGHDDTRIQDNYWRKFAESPASAPFKVGDKI